MGARFTVLEGHGPVWLDDAEAGYRMLLPTHEGRDAALLYAAQLCESLNRAPTTTIELGFASFKDGTFELIVRDPKTSRETTLHGFIRPSQWDAITELLPTCVFVKHEAAPTPQPARETIDEPV